MVRSGRIDPSIAHTMGPQDEYAEREQFFELRPRSVTKRKRPRVRRGDRTKR